MKTQPTPDTRSKDEMRTTTRIAAAGVGAVALIAALHGIGHAAKKVSDHVHEGVTDVYDFQNSFTTPDHLTSEGAVREGIIQKGIDPTTVTLHKVTSDESNPTEVALDLHAKNTKIVADEIAGQVGGLSHLQSGEYVAVPNDQLKPTDH